ncbi:zinc finger protein 506 [Biomphalaria pfeifferi]|uniref:Zinc finger protein 506 n=1 Tax=Biomphalaria pfeifferi TaxID=112525 RepID=A0AAD8FJU1_BIOPF|nr:zinc finger protein 506 [Biomphalaria pfeifferi]
MASKSAKPSFGSPSQKNKPGGPSRSRRKRKTSKPRKRTIVLESCQEEVSSPGGSNITVSELGNSQWHEPLPISNDDSDKGQQENLSVADVNVTPKKEIIPGFVVDQWCELGPSIYRDGHSPSQLGKAKSVGVIEFKSSPDSGNYLLEKSVKNVHRKLNLDMAENEAVQGSKACPEIKVEEAESECLYQAVTSQFAQTNSNISTSVSSQSKSSGQNVYQYSSPTLRSMAIGQLSYHPYFTSDHYENRVTPTRMRPGNKIVSNAKSATKNNEQHILFQLVQPADKYRNTSPVVAYNNSAINSCQGKTSTHPNQATSFNENKLERNTIISHFQVHRQSTKFNKVSKSANSNDKVKLLLGSTMKPKMSNSEDFIDPTSIKFGLDDGTDDDSIPCKSKLDSESSDEEWKPSKLQGKIKPELDGPFSLVESHKDGKKVKKSLKRRKVTSGKLSVTCPTCGKHFRGTYHLRRHEMSHSENRPYVCMICKKSFKQKAHLHGHMGVHKRCRQTNNDTAESIAQSKTQSSKCPGRPRKIYTEKDLSCKNCGKCFKTVYRLKRHEQSHTDIRPFTCKICGKGFKQTGHRNEHQANHEKGNKKCFLCNMCGVVFRCRSSFNNHMRSHNVEKVRLQQTRAEDDGCIKQDGIEINHSGYDCPYCPDKFATAQALNSHLETHVEVKHRRHVQPYSCDVCKRTFTYRHNLLKHQLAHKAPDKYAQFYQKKIEAHVASGKPSFSCSVCAKVFIRKETLAKHSKIHSGKKPFKCSICEREFTQNVHLKVHMRKHTGSRPFQCKDCNRGFIDSTALAKHIEYEACNSENALYRCKVCDKRHYYLGSIKQHIRKHHGAVTEDSIAKYILKFERSNKRKNSLDSDKFSCRVCSKRFTEKCNLVRHVRNKHSELLELLSSEKSSETKDNFLEWSSSQVNDNACDTSSDVKSALDKAEHVEGDMSRELTVEECHGEKNKECVTDKKKNHIERSYDKNLVPERSYTHRMDGKRIDDNRRDNNLLEGFNTADFDRLDEHMRHESCLTRSGSPNSDSDAESPNESPPHYDINFLYNIGLIVSNKAKKYKELENVPDTNTNNDKACRVLYKPVQSSEADQANAQNMNVAQNESPAQGDFMLESLLYDSNISKSNEIPGNIPTTRSTTAICSGLGMLHKETMIDEAKIIRSFSTDYEPDSKLENKNCQSATVLPDSNSCDDHTLEGLTKMSPSKTIPHSVSYNEFITSANEPRSHCFPQSTPDNDVLTSKKDKDSREGEGENVLSTLNVHCSAMVDKSVMSINSNEPTNNMATSKTALNGIFNQLQNSMTQNACLVLGDSNTAATSNALTKGMLPMKSNDDDYESCPTESQLNCLGLLACRDSVEVISKAFSPSSLFARVKPWLQELVKSSKPTKEKCVTQSATHKNQLHGRIVSLNIEGGTCRDNKLERVKVDMASKCRVKHRPSIARRNLEVAYQAESSQNCNTESNESDENPNQQTDEVITLSEEFSSASDDARKAVDSPIKDQPPGKNGCVAKQESLRTTWPMVDTCEKQHEASYSSFSRERCQKQVMTSSREAFSFSANQETSVRSRSMVKACNEQPIVPLAWSRANECQDPLLSSSRGTVFNKSHEASITSCAWPEVPAPENHCFSTSHATLEVSNKGYAVNEPYLVSSSLSLDINHESLIPSTVSTLLSNQGSPNSSMSSSLMASTTSPSTPDTTTKIKSSFPCTVCAKTFHARHQLKRHELTHTDHRPYNCDKCGRSFRQKVHLSDHTKRHQGERPFACEGCGKCFVLKNEMNQHVKNHCKGATNSLVKSRLDRATNQIYTVSVGQLAPLLYRSTYFSSVPNAKHLDQPSNLLPSTSINYDETKQVLDIDHSNELLSARIKDEETKHEVGMGHSPSVRVKNEETKHEVGMGHSPSVRVKDEETKHEVGMGHSPSVRVKEEETKHEVGMGHSPSIRVKDEKHKHLVDIHLGHSPGLPRTRIKDEKDQQVLGIGYSPVVTSVPFKEEDTKHAEC